MALLSFALSFIAHNMYVYFPNIVTSIFFPVDESVWEHMKIISTCILLSSVVEQYVYKCKGIKANNFIISIPITIILSIIIYLVMYYMIELIIPHSLYVSIALLFLVFLIGQSVSYYILNKRQIKNEKLIGIIILVVIYLIFIIFTPEIKNC